MASTEKAHTGGNNKVFVTTVKKRSSQGRTTSSLGSSATQETFISGSAAKSDDNNNVSSTDPTPARELQQQRRTTVTHANKKAAQEGNLRKFGSAKNKKRVIMGSSFSTVILMLLAAIAKRKKIAHCLKWLKCCPKCRSKDAEFSKPTESSTLEDIKVPIPFEVTGGIRKKTTTEATILGYSIAVFSRCSCTFDNLTAFVEVNISNHRVTKASFWSLQHEHSGPYSFENEFD